MTRPTPSVAVNSYRWAAKAAEISNEQLANLEAVYLSGSLATAGFSARSSDLDLVVVLSGRPSTVALGLLANSVQDLGFPPAPGGLDMELFLASDVGHPRPPLTWHGWLRWYRSATSIEVHDLAPYLEVDWAPSLALTRVDARALVGPPAEAVIGAVDSTLVLKASLEELNWDAPGDNWSLPGGILSACRAWWFWAEQGLGSKVDAGKWAWKRAGQGDRDVIARALAFQETGNPHDLALAEVQRFNREVKAMIESGRRA